jgi:CheY-like chemotaxis protein
MVHGLVVQSGGEFQISSRVGVGTVVHLNFPIVAQAAEATQGQPAHAPGVRPDEKRLILVVDDDPLVLEGTSAMLEDVGHDVIEASSGRAALEVLESGSPVDLVITDQVMPQMRGTELLQEINRRWPHLPVVLASGYAESHLGPLNLLRLNKPYGQDELVSVINASMSAAKQSAG